MGKAGLVDISAGDVFLGSVDSVQISFARELRGKVERLREFRRGTRGDFEIEIFTGHPPTPVIMAENEQGGVNAEVIFSIELHVSDGSAEWQAAIGGRLGARTQLGFQRTGFGKLAFEVSGRVTGEEGNCALACQRRI